LSIGFSQGVPLLKWESPMSGKSMIPAPRVVVNPPAAMLGVQNAILWGTGKLYHVADFPGPLSVKTVVRGSALWSTSEADRIVDESSYLVLNSGQTYSITIDSHETVETFCLFFRRGITEDVCRIEGSDPTSLLDNLDDTAGEAILRSNSVANAGSYSSQAGACLEFFETLHTHDSDVSPVIRRIYARLKDKTASDAWLEDQFLGVAAALSSVHAQADKRASRIPAKKHSTRVELYRRLLRGRDYMDSFSGGQVHLDKVAHQACLSPYHFHRLFHQVFRETPNQYLQRKRLATAKRLLERGEQSITNICLEVGFESITSFSGLFRRNFGCSPREYRSRNLALRRH
jgi:AraC family transcriptional regulator